MKLYAYWRSTAAYRVRIALNVKGLEYDIVPVNLLQAADSRAAVSYRGVNPQGLVPTLVDGDDTLVQSMAIIEYLEERYPAPALLPADAATRATARGLAQIVAADMHPLNNLRVLNYLRGELGADDGVVHDWYAHWIAKGFDALEALVSRHRGTYCIGDDVTIADVCLVPQLYNARRFDCDVEPYPNLVEIATRCEAIDAFRRAAPDLQPDAV